MYKEAAFQSVFNGPNGIGITVDCCNADAAGYKDGIEAALARSVRFGTQGRPRKKRIDEGMSKQCGLGLKGK